MREQDFLAFNAIPATQFVPDVRHALASGRVAFLVQHMTVGQLVQPLRFVSHGFPHLDRWP